MASNSHREPLGIVSHASFRRKTGAAQLGDYLHDSRVRVASRAAFTKMQDHIDRLYDGVDVVHSFEDASGQVFDCIPIEQQPGLRDTRGPMPLPPDMSHAPTLGGAGGSYTTAKGAMARPDVDRHGNERRAPQGTIPMRRITLDELTRFHDLNAFFRKHPRRQAPRSTLYDPSTPSADSSQNHRYAVGRQQVANIGGTSYLSINQPAVSSNEIFSLAQHWYSGGSGAGLQTVEVGWQVFPTKYGNASPNLFIYYTPDGYASGSYNLDNANTFVQLHNTYTIGGALSPASVPGGQQQWLLIGVYKWGNAWWIYLNGFSNDNLLGYYPTSLFGSGQMATQADTIDYGGETVSGNPPNGDWGPMGSGANASAGWPQAAFHCYIYYWTPAGASAWANLSQVGASPCYGYAQGFDSSSWGTYLYFGGPGGGDC